MPKANNFELWQPCGVLSENLTIVKLIREKSCVYSLNAFVCNVQQRQMVLESIGFEKDSPTLCESRLYWILAIFPSTYAVFTRSLGSLERVIFFAHHLGYWSTGQLGVNSWLEQQDVLGVVNGIRCSFSTAQYLQM